MYHQNQLYTRLLLFQRPLMVLLFILGHYLNGHAQTADFTVSMTGSCAPIPVNFKDITPGVVSRQWDLGNGPITKTEAEVGGNFNVAGTYDIKLTVTFANGSTNTRVKQIEIHPKPVADFIASTYDGCGPLTVQFNDASTSNPGQITKWNWSIGEGSYSTKNPTHTFNTIGDYDVTLFVENEWGCKSEAVTKPQLIKVHDRPNPAFSITSNSNCNLPFTPTFTNNSTGEGTLNYTWNFGEGGDITGANPGHTYTTAGIYPVTLKANNGTNCDRSTASQTVYVGKPSGPVTLTAPANTCINSSASFSISGIPAANWVDKVEWNLGNGNTRTTSGFSLSYTYTTAASYPVTATVFYRSGCQEVLSTNITVFPTPTVTLQANPTNACKLPFTSNFTATASPANPAYTYEWNFGDNPASTVGAAALAHTYNQPGNYQVRVTVKDPGNPNTVCNNNSATTTVRVAIPSLEIYRITPQMGCKPLNVRFDTRWNNLITTSNNIQYSWNFGDGTPIVSVTDNGSTGSIQHTYQNAGTFTAVVTATTADGCTSSSRIDVVVDETCPPPPDPPEITGGGFGDNGGACDNYLSYTFSAEYIAGTTVSAWDFGDPAAATNTAGAVNNVTHVFSAPGNYTITITRIVTATGKILTNTRTIEVKYDPLEFTIKANPIATCPGSDITLSVEGLDPKRVNYYRWNFGDGTPVQNIYNPAPPATQLTGTTTHSFALNGTYSVSLSVTDRKGCLTEAGNTVPIIVNGPAADFSADLLRSCDNQFTVNFTPDATPIDPSVPITNWRWNFGDGSAAVSANNPEPVAHNYSNNSYYRTYNVSLTVTDANGCQSEVHLKNEYIKAYNPKASFYAASPLRCNDYNVRFYNNSSVKGEPAAPSSRYTWDYGDGSPLFSTNSDASHTHVYPGDGEYTVTLIVVDENGCTDTVEQKNYIRIVHPKADFEPGASITECAPISLGFNNLSETFGQTAAYTWTFGYNNARSTLRNPQPVIYPVPNDYQVTLIVNAMGCADTVTKTINVKGPRGVLHSESFEGCRPLRIAMNVTGSNISSYAWDFDDGSVITPSATESNTTHIYNYAGIYVPNVILTSPEGCTFSLKPTDKVFVDSLQVRMSVSDTSFCEAGTVHFTNSTVLPSFSAIQQQRWNLGDNSTFAGPVPPAHHFSAPGNYPVQLITQTRYGCIDTASTTIRVGAAPEVTISGPSVICLSAEQSMPFKATVLASQPVTHYQWSLNGQPLSSNTDSVNIQSRQSGNHLLSLRVTTEGCDAQTSQPFAIDSVRARFSISDSSYCGSAAVLFTNNSSAASAIRNFAFNTGDINNSQLPLTGGQYIYQQPGIYQASLQLETIHGCRDSFLLAERIAVHQLPQLTFDIPPAICVGEQVTLNATIQSEDAVSGIDWQFNNSTAISGNNLLQQFDQSGTYNITASTQTQYGCSTSITRPLSVNPLPIPNAQPAISNICEGGSITLQAEDGIVYHWSTPIGSMPDGGTATPIVTPSITTYYFVKVTNEFGCEQSDSVKVIVDKKVNLQHSDNTIICVGEAVQLQASGNTSQFDWSPAEGLNRTDISNPIARPQQNTIYQVTGVSANSCPSETGHILVVVGPYPSVVIGEDIVLQGGQSHTWSPLVSDDVQEFKWSPSTGLSCNTCKAPSFIADKNMQYMLTVTNEYNCATSDTVNVQVICNKDAIYIPNAFTPNGDGVNDRFYIPGFGVEQIKSFTVYSRYGDVVYSQKNVPIGSKSYGWDGTVKGKTVETTTVFVYTAEIVCNGRPLFFKGTVTLIR